MSESTQPALSYGSTDNQQQAASSTATLVSSSGDSDFLNDDPKLINGKESWNYPPRNVLKTVSMFWGMIAFGMNDASVGVLVKSVSKSLFFYGAILTWF